jgi:hypothetical protein
MMHGISWTARTIGRLGRQEVSHMMKFRTLLLAVLAFTVLAGSVVPANAATHKHHKKHHHKK